MSSCSGRHTLPPPTSYPTLLLCAIPPLALLTMPRVSAILISDNGDALWCLKYSLLSASCSALCAFRSATRSSSGHGLPSRPAQLTSSIFTERRRFCCVIGSVRGPTPEDSSFGADSKGDLGGTYDSSSLFVGAVPGRWRSFSSCIASVAETSCR